MKTTFVAMAPDGTLMERTTQRSYTHAVIGQLEDGRWVSIAFCGSLKLAQTRLRETIKANEAYRTWGDSKYFISNQRIVEANPAWIIRESLGKKLH